MLSSSLEVLVLFSKVCCGNNHQSQKAIQTRQNYATGQMTEYSKKLAWLPEGQCEGPWGTITRVFFQVEQRKFKHSSLIDWMSAKQSMVSKYQDFFGVLHHGFATPFTCGWRRFDHHTYCDGSNKNSSPPFLCLSQTCSGVMLAVLQWLLAQFPQTVVPMSHIHVTTPPKLNDVKSIVAAQPGYTVYSYHYASCSPTIHEYTLFAHPAL